MHPVQLIALVVVSLGVTALARRRNWSAPLLSVGIGMVMSLIPGVSRFELHPELLLSVVLPPLLYSASLDSSYVGFRASIRPIVGLGVGLVVATAFTIGLVAHLLMPSLPFGADEQSEDTRSDAAARQAATTAAVHRLVEVLPKATAALRPEVAEQVRQRLIGMVEFRGRTISAHIIGDTEGKHAGIHHAITSLRRELLGAQREAFAVERDAGRLDDEVMRTVLRELDLEEATLTSSWRSRL